MMTFKQMLKGGKIIAQTRSSCIVFPAVDKSNKEISKFTSKIAASSEMDSTKYLRPHDPQEKYGIYPKGPLNCNKSQIIDYLKDERSSSNEKCHIAQHKSPCVYSVELYTHDLSKWPAYETSKSIMAGLLHLWQCVAFLHAHHCTHNDIKSLNIAYRAQFTGRPEMFALTDWGLSIFNLNRISEDDAVDQVNFISQSDVVYDPKKNKNGYWNPFLGQEASLKYKSVDLLYSNDIFSMSLFQRNFITKHQKKLDSKGLPYILHAMNLIVNEPEYSVKIKAQRIIDKLKIHYLSS